MPISGLVVTLGDRPAHVDAVLAKLRTDPRVTVGERVGPLQPIVIDTCDRVEDRRLRESLDELGGILKVDIVFVYLDEDGCSQPEPQASSVSSSSSEADGGRGSLSSSVEDAAC